MGKALKAIVQLVTMVPSVGEALVPYYRQLLPVVNIFKGKNCKFFLSV